MDDDSAGMSPCPACNGPAAIRDDRVSLAHTSWCPVSERRGRWRKLTAQLDRIEQRLIAREQTGAAEHTSIPQEAFA